MPGIDDLVASDNAASAPNGIDALVASDNGGHAAASAPAAAAPSQNDPGFWASLGAGLGHGFGSTVLGGEQLVGRGLGALAPAGSPAELAANAITNDANAGLRKINAQYSPYSAARPYTAGAGNIGGGMVAAAPLAALAPGGALVGGAVSGAAGAVAQPVDPDAQDYWQQKAEQTAAGGAGGAILGPTAAGIGRVFAPNALSPAAADLAARGVRLTPGQQGNGLMNTIEQKAMSLPIVGHSIANARQTAVEDFNRAAYNDALEPLGAQVPDSVPVGGEGVQHVKDTIGAAYDNLENQATFNYDYPLHAQIDSIKNTMAGNGATPQALQQFDNILKQNVMDKMDPNTGMMDGTQWGNTRSMLNTIERNNRLGQPTADQTELANAVGSLNDAVADNVVRNSPAGIQQDLQNANDAYARYKTIERAAGYTGARRSGNVFTPQQYEGAVGARSTAAQKATGTGLNSDLAQNAMDVLANTVPNSGTGDRLMQGGLIGAALTHPAALLHPATLVGVPAAMGLYSKPGVALMNAAMNSRPAAVRAAGNALRAYLPKPLALGSGVAFGNAVNPQDAGQ
jgi:hypothetical protein